MDDERFLLLYFLLLELSPRRAKRQQFGDAQILQVYLWAALNNKPVYWACDARHKPRVWSGPLPSPSSVCRRMRSASVLALRDALLLRLQQRRPAESSHVGCWIVDAKGFPVNRFSKDKQAKLGHCSVGKARGYKLFMLTTAAGAPAAWRVGPMNAGEPTVARELIEHIDRPGYLLADSIYDSNELHELAAAKQVQLVAPRKEPNKNIDKRCRGEARMHAIAMLETPVNTFGPALYNGRTQIERSFSRWSSSAVGLDHLPGWVRTIPRVTQWINAKIALALAA
jgi:hypothetical protein